MAFSTQLSVFLLALAIVYIVDAQQLPGPPDVGGPDIRPHFVKGPIPAEKAGIKVSFISCTMDSDNFHSFSHRFLPKMKALGEVFTSLTRAFPRFSQGGLAPNNVGIADVNVTELSEGQSSPYLEGVASVTVTLTVLGMLGIFE